MLSVSSACEQLSFPAHIWCPYSHLTSPPSVFWVTELCVLSVGLNMALSCALKNLSPGTLFPGSSASLFRYVFCCVQFVHGDMACLINNICCSFVKNNILFLLVKSSVETFACARCRAPFPYVLCFNHTLPPLIYISLFVCFSIFVYVCLFNINFVCVSFSLSFSICFFFYVDHFLCLSIAVAYLTTWISLRLSYYR